MASASGGISTRHFNKFPLGDVQLLMGGPHLGDTLSLSLCTEVTLTLQPLRATPLS